MIRLRSFLPFARPATSPPPTADARSLADDARHAELMAVVKDEGAAGRAALLEPLERLTGEVGRLGREQFRASTLLEGQSTILEELAESWREYVEGRAREGAELRRLLSELEGQVRVGMVKDLLPVADALDASVRAAHELLSEQPAPAPHRPSLLGRLRGRQAEPTVAPDRDAAMESWLQGLLLIERRLLALLEREGVRPIPALGQAFDPHRHLAVAATEASGVPEGTVVGEELRGYALGEKVLRHAEVVVARRGNGVGDAQTTDVQAQSQWQ